MAIDEPMVDILMSTYNGEAYLAEQLDSLLAQSHAHWRLLVKDDGSSDGSVALLREYRDAHPDRIHLVELNGGKGACASFAQLLELAEASYVMFCDQDDVWKPEKIALSLEAMRSAEAKHGADTPILVYTDLEVVDRELNPIAPSFWRFQHIDPERVRLSQLALENVVTGCTTMLNRPLREAALPVSDRALMHDWWLALVAAARGRLVCVPRATILYRQHGANDVGASRYSLLALLRRHLFGNGLMRYARFHQARNGQNTAFYARYAETLADEERTMLRSVLALYERGPIKRARALLRLSDYPNGRMRKLFFAVSVLLMPARR